MKKILYIMNVDWNWIKQRPHFIAEKLGESYNVLVVYQYRYGRKNYQKRNAEKIWVKPLYVIPKGDRYPLTSKINSFLMRIQIRRIARKFDPNWIYTTFPTQIRYIDGLNTDIIYDCMDNHPSFIVDGCKKEALILQEGRLVKRAQKILCSSQKLQEVLLERYGSENKNKIEIVRNGYNGELLKAQLSPGNQSKYIIAYFGTISSWFNFDFLVRSLEQFPQLEYLLMGPVTGVEIPKHDRVHYIGTVEHDALYDTIKSADCLFMPFVVNDIIQSVDPVKLYEYINMGKDILCVRYPEVERFEPFVNFYNTYQEYINKITLLMQEHNRKYTEAQRRKFLSENDWTSRVEIIKKIVGE